MNGISLWRPSSSAAPIGGRSWILVFLIVLLWNTAALADWHPVWLEGRRYVPIEDVANFYGYSIHQADGSFFLNSSQRKLSGRLNSREFFIDGVKYILCFPIRSENGRPFLASIDLLKIVEPVLRPHKIQNSQPLKTIVLDAGHGGYDTGATSFYGPEKAFTLDIVRRTARILRQSGYQVCLTRTTDTFVPLGRRAAVANSIPNSIFISIHFNQSAKMEARGVETYCVAPLGVPSMDEEFVTSKDLRHYPGQRQDPQNIALATAIHAAVVRGLEVPDRGIKRARYAVIRELQVPGVLIEGGFLSDPADLRGIASIRYREQLAQSIAWGVDVYRKVISTFPSRQNQEHKVEVALRDNRSLWKIIAPGWDIDLPGLLPLQSPKF